MDSPTFEKRARILCAWVVVSAVALGGSSCTDVQTPDALDTKEGAHQAGTAASDASDPSEGSHHAAEVGRILTADDVAKLYVGMSVSDVIELHGYTLTSLAWAPSYPAADGGKYFLLFIDINGSSCQDISHLRAVLKTNGVKSELEDAVYVLPVERQGERFGSRS